MDGNFRELFRKFCVEGSILGLKYFYIYPDAISRCFWAVTMLGITYTAFVLTWLLYIRFRDIPTRITIENQYEPLAEVSFPAITICTPNQVTFSAMNHFNRTLVDGNLTLNLEKVLPMLLAFYVPIKLEPEATNDLEHFQSLVELNRYTLPEVMFALPQRCEDFLRMCVFEGEVFPNCRGLLRPVLTAHGLCCIFNSVYFFKDGKRNEKDSRFKSRSVTTSGYLKGLTVITDYNPADALDHTILNAGSTRVMFNDMNEFPSDDEMKLVHADSQSFHILHATYTYCSEEVQQLPVWSRKCYYKWEQLLPYFGDYHNADCDSLCYVKAVEKACECQLFYAPNIRLGKACNATSIFCVMRVKLHLYKYISPEECDCLRDCDYMRYRTDTTIGNLKGLPYVINKPYTDLVFNKSTSMMHFYFTSSVYVKQKQETVMSLITLTSNLGGVFGLCLGCSAMSVLEILFYIYIVIRNHVRRRLQHQVYPVLN
ncbi:sodium channel protein Nach isoform X1 [Amyelois transitella]|uniref:sodium channel protein Nach isoform X1 n=2 Tax=Amyelois transitella TaxID=680683 RepID=UPI0029905622|nr:sodium channel protein Nach isoform X1 [Amyelois transitella]XP_060805298.1 sodium channel protein Nach isoform X1 [Amyelois transitella]